MCKGMGYVKGFFRGGGGEGGKGGQGVAEGKQGARWVIPADIVSVLNCIKSHPGHQVAAMIAKDARCQQEQQQQQQQQTCRHHLTTGRNCIHQEQGKAARETLQPTPEEEEDVGEGGC